MCIVSVEYALCVSDTWSIDVVYEYIQGISTLLEYLRFMGFIGRHEVCMPCTAVHRVCGMHRYMVICGT